jgi:hypothetical protein
MQLDFSQFHALDHFPGTRYCRTLPGGWRNHIVLDWNFRRKADLMRWTSCKVGQHCWNQGYQRAEDETPEAFHERMKSRTAHDFEVCRNCRLDRP